MPNNIGINNVSNINLSKNKKNAYGVDFNHYIYLPILIILLIMGVLFSLKTIITSNYVPNA